MEATSFFSFDDTKLNAYELNSAKEKKAVVQIIHGMGEHAGRYENLANFLVSQGFVVFMSDHRAHGKTAETLSEIGVYENDIFYDTVRDQIYISEYLLQKYQLPLIVIGHSFGSFILQRYHELYHKQSAIILIGSGFLKNDINTYLGELLAIIGAKIKGKKAPAKLIHNLTFKKYNAKFADKNWLTSSKEEQQKQRTDRYCNRIFSYNFYKHFFKGIRHIYLGKQVSKIKLKTPILILSGELDALNKEGNGIQKLQEFYKNNGVNKVALKIYKTARHEVLNETLKEDVYNDILQFITDIVPVQENKVKEKIKK